VNARDLGRLGVLAVGLGIGAAVSHSPVAAADSTTDWLSSIDSFVSGGALPAPAVSTLNLDISFDGDTIYSSGSAYAATEPGEYGLAIAYGADSEAVAASGTGDYALASGAGAYAVAGGALGSGSGNNFDSAIDIGSNTGSSDGVFALDGSNDSAVQIGNNTGAGDGAFAGHGSNNSAIDFGNNSGENDGPIAGYGEYNIATDDANNTSEGAGCVSGFGNYNVAEVAGSNSADDAGGYDASVLGNNDIAYVLDPFGTVGSYAEAGGSATTPGDGDIAAVLGVDDTQALALGSNLLYDIVTALGNESGTAASTSGGLLGELLSLF
jgi:hypothetical protein